MKYCSNCQSINIKLMSSFHTRLLLSIYLFLNFYFFTGVIDYGALIALIPFIIPYSHKCSDCNTTFFGMPRINLNNFWVGNIPGYLFACNVTFNTYNYTLNTELPKYRTRTYSVFTKYVLSQ